MAVAKTLKSCSQQNMLEDLCISLAEAESEKSVISILKDCDLWDDETAWHLYGDMENNFSSIGNQQDSSDAALVEKFINSSDAILTCKALVEGVDPESKEAPKSMSDALKKFFNIQNGALSSVSDFERAKLSENIGFVASGGKTNPCYSIYDFGTGQAPSEFPNTFMSLNASNKIKINFVQGKFNMGSTGVLQFCGKENLQLVISKKHTELTNKTEDQDLWGFTIVRRESPKGNMKSSTYRYLAPNGKVLSFESDEIPILPDKYPNPYGKGMKHGTYIKLYDYDIGPGLRTNILLDLYNRLNLLMPKVALPIRFYERRKGYSAHSYESTFSGLSTRVEDDKKNNLEEGFPCSASFRLNDSDIRVEIYAFRDKDGKSAKEKYASNDGIIFSQNGQTQGVISKQFFTRKVVGMSYLANNLLISVDCSDLDSKQREDLFMNNRCHIRHGDIKKEIEKNLINIISGHTGLKALREEKKRKVIEEKLGDDKPLSSILEKLITNSPALSSLLITGQRITNPFKSTEKKQKEVFVGKSFPSFFSLNNNFDVNNPKSCELGRDFRLKFTTDAENQYFSRDVDPGILTITSDFDENIKYRSNLWNGSANITICLPDTCKVGETISYEYTVDDCSRAEPIVGKFVIEVVSKVMHKTNDTKKRRELPSSDEKGDDTEGQSRLEPPIPIAVHKDDWGKHNFDQFSALKVVYNSESYDYYYNADNVYLKLIEKSSNDDELKVIDTQYKIALVLIGMSLIKEYTEMEDDAENEIDIEKNVAELTRCVSPVLLPIIRELGSISIDEN